MSLEILDDQELGPAKSNSINYRRYTITYIVLMVIIGAFLTNIMHGPNLNYFNLITGALTYFIFSTVIFVVLEGISSIYNWLTGKKPARNHPHWFTYLEGTFYIWCFIRIVTFVGNKIV